MTTPGTQVANQTEEQQMQFIQGIVSFLQDAAHLPTLKREVEGLRAEVERLNRYIGDLKAEIELEREAKLKANARVTDHATTINRLSAKLSRAQHRLDTMQGIVLAAVEEERLEQEREAREKAEAEQKATEAQHVVHWPDKFAV